MTVNVIARMFSVTSTSQRYALFSFDYFFREDLRSNDVTAEASSPLQMLMTLGQRFNDVFCVPNGTATAIELRISVKGIQTKRRELLTGLRARRM